MESKVRLASVGLGWWGSVLATGAAATGAEIAGGFARREESREAFVESHGGLASFREVLAAEDVDGILIATPRTTHADVIVAAAEAGKQVPVEKPFTLDVVSGRKAIEATESAGVVLQVGHNKRRQPASRPIKEMIESGALRFEDGFCFRTPGSMRDGNRPARLHSLAIVS